MRAKYGNKKTAGFDSAKEARRYAELVILERIGEISELETQVTYELLKPKGKERGVKYIADFRYIENGKVITEDCKGFRTREYILKRKMMNSLLDIQIRET